MKFVAKSAMFIVASVFVAVSPAIAGPPPVPVPLAGAGLLGFAGLLYLGRKLRRTR